MHTLLYLALAQVLFLGQNGLKGNAMPSGGGTYTAASCSQADIAAAIAAEQVSPADGDIIAIPACSHTWTGGSSLTQTFTNSVTIQGAGAISSTTGGAGTTGTDQTIIIDNLSTGNAMTFNTVAGKSFRFTGIALLENGSSPVSSGGMLQVGGTSTEVRVDHNHFYSHQGGSSSFHINGSVQGVADHNYFEALSGILNNHLGFQNGQGWGGGSSGDWGDGSWHDIENWGTSQFFFIEDSRFYNGDTCDTVFGARFVFRYNTVDGDGASSQQMFWHGATSGRERGGRAAEVYNNTFTQAGNYGSPPLSMNSGTALVHSNTMTGGYKSLVQISYDFRTTIGGGGAYIYLPTPNGWNFCGATAGGPTAWDSNLNATGYACLDQPGRGAGDLLNGQNFPSALNTATGTIAWPHEALSPIYVWNNSCTPMFYTTVPCVTENTGGSDGSIASNNREWYMQFGTLWNAGSFNGTAGVGQGLFSAIPGSCTGGTDPVTGGNAPGVGYWATDQSTLYICNPTNTWTSYYTPYTYPHPLTGSSVDNPVISPASGGYTSPQTVSISEGTGGATVCYTTDGSTPTTDGAGSCTHGTTYSSSFSQSIPATVKAIGTAAGLTDSSVVTNTYTSTSTVSNPAISPNSGSYSSPQTISITDGTGGATICYTTDGSTPTTNSAGTCTHGSTYSTSFSQSIPATVKAIGTKSGLTDSSVVTNSYSSLSAPNPPTGVRVVINQYPHFGTVAWTPPSGAAGDSSFSYNVYRGVSSGSESGPLNGSPVQAGCVTILDCTYQDNAVTLGATYFYTVKTVFSTFESVGSNEVHGQITPAGPGDLSGTLH